jgi:putative heme-binding domain-containing protein
MPAFGPLLQRDEIRAVVGYMRRAGGQGGTAWVPGDQARGESLFFGKAGCGDCHMVRGKGGFLGADLSGYGRDHSPAQILRVILHPDAGLHPGAGPGPGPAAVTAVTRNGQQWIGVARNEDNFSIQLLDANGVFHLIMKSDLASLKREPRSLMPGDYGSRLSVRELQDLVGYLARMIPQPQRSAGGEARLLVNR